MRKALSALLCCLIVFLPSCDMLTQHQRQSGSTAIEDAYDRGELTSAQRDAALDALNKGDTGALTEILMTAGSELASVLLGVPIAVGRVRKERGPTETERTAARAKA